MNFLLKTDPNRIANILTQRQVHIGFASHKGESTWICEKIKNANIDERGVV